MDTYGFKNYLRKATYMLRGKAAHYTENAVNSRVSKAVALENDLGIDLDDYVTSDERFEGLLYRIRAAKIEDPAHTPKSNAARHYYKYKNNGKEFGRIF
ncbi:MAG: hypothetical protein LBP26_01180 [Clostridiales bacterium]|jgi:hypothetical protein|nr:hypothetical protein [Clostridiales bacterium]